LFCGQEEVGVVVFFSEKGFQVRGISRKRRRRRRGQHELWRDEVVHMGISLSLDSS
jgi:hypothetical protein